ncbi:hypothetical protein M0R45_009265 [Rubus argutus]|uniref:Uncharacterized protein n=1 Tax=Rubus argutus TaxID=59490 RepID=A0AAW1Y6Z8_RUBAR
MGKNAPLSPCPAKLSTPSAQSAPLPPLTQAAPMSSTRAVHCPRLQPPDGVAVPVHCRISPLLRIEIHGVPVPMICYTGA